MDSFKVINLPVSPREDFYHSDPTDVYVEKHIDIVDRTGEFLCQCYDADIAFEMCSLFNNHYPYQSIP